MAFSGVRLIEYFAIKGSEGHLEVLESGKTRYYRFKNLLYASFSKDPFDIEEDTLDVLEVKYQVRELRGIDFELIGFNLIDKYSGPPYHHLIFEGNGSLHLIFQQFTESNKNWS